MKNLTLKNTYITSDHHFSHKNILKYTNREFSLVEEMNEHMINEWNSVVTDNDTVFYLGDFCFERNPTKINEILYRLKGDIVFIKGNHDSEELCRNKRFSYVADYYELAVEGYRFVMMHYPLLEWNGGHKGNIMLHGHCHGNLGKITNRRVDVGVDSLGYKPKNLSQIIQYIKDKNVWEILPKHHD
jgi:calcineurin-like phosphoesterase family protein